MATSPTSLDNDKRVSDLPGITRILEGLIEARSLISVFVGEETEQGYTSAVLAAYPDKQQFVMDELSMNKGHKELLQQKKLSAYAILKGVKVFFKADLRKVAEKKSIPYYVLNFPEFIHYGQQRSSFRVLLPNSAKSSVKILSTYGQLVDLSIGGVGFMLPSGMAVRSGEILMNVLIQLPHGGSFHCDLEVCHVMSQFDKRHNRIGAKFMGLPKNMENQLHRTIIKLERSKLKPED